MRSRFSAVLRHDRLAVQAIKRNADDEFDTPEKRPRREERVEVGEDTRCGGMWNKMMSM